MKRIVFTALLALVGATGAAWAQQGDWHGGGYGHGGPPPGNRGPQGEWGSNGWRGGNAHAWARGENYHQYYRGPVTVVNNYPRYHLRRPPSGYHWIQDNSGNFLLVAITSGVIADLLLH